MPRHVRLDVVPVAVQFLDWLPIRVRGHFEVFLTGIVEVKN